MERASAWVTLDPTRVSQMRLSPTSSFSFFYPPTSSVIFMEGSVARPCCCITLCAASSRSRTGTTFTLLVHLSQLLSFWYVTLFRRCSLGLFVLILLWVILKQEVGSFTNSLFLMKPTSCNVCQVFISFLTLSNYPSPPSCPVM